MNAETQVRTEAEIRELIDGWLKAVLDRDVERIASHYTPDILAYDAIAALQFKGVEAYRRHWENCLTMCPGPMTFEIHDLNVTAGDEVAYCTYLTRCGGTDEKGQEQTGWMRTTIGCRRIGGKWRIAHEHFSSPFDPQSGKALMDLQP